MAGVIGGPPVLAGAEATRAVFNACLLGLFKDEELPVEWDVLANYTQPDNSGYDMIPAVFLAPVPEEGPTVHIVTDGMEWTPDEDEDQEFVWGWFLYHPESGKVVAAASHGLAKPFVVVGQFKLTIDYTLAFHVFPGA